MGSVQRMGKSWKCIILRSKNFSPDSFAKIIAASILLLSHHLFATEQKNTSPKTQASTRLHKYTVRKNDTLIKLSSSLGILNIWTPQVSATSTTQNFTFSIEPKRSINLIYPGDIIFLSSTFEKILIDRKQRGLISITDHGEVIFLCSQESLNAWIQLKKELSPQSDPFTGRHPHFFKDCLRAMQNLVNATEKPPTDEVVPSQPIAPPEEKAVAKKQHTPKIDSHVEFVLGSGFSELKSQYKDSGSEAHLLSGNIQSMNLRWVQLWSESLNSFVSWNYFTSPFERADVGMLNNPSQNGLNFSFGGILHFSDGLQFETSLGSRVSFFSPSYAPGSATLEKRNLPVIEMSVLKNLVKVRSLKMQAGLRGTFLGPANIGSYTIQSGFGYSGLLRVEQSLKQYRIFSDFFYQTTHQETSITKNDYNEVWMRLGFSWDLENQ